MVRTQITFDREMQKRARHKAAELGISLAEYVRRAVARDLASPKAKLDVSSIFNLGSSGGSNIARDKDALIAESIETLHQR